MSWKNARQLSVSSLVPGLKCQEDLLALLVDAPRAEDRFAGKAGTEPLGDAVDEQVEELVLREVPGRERFVLLPESLGDLAHRRPRQERPPLLVGERRLDVPRREPAGIHFDGQPLQPEHGGPVRFLVPHLYFWKSAKWVRGIRLQKEEQPGFWESNGYNIYGDPWREQRYWGD